MSELGNAEKQEVDRRANNQVENSQLPFRRRERAMLQMEAKPFRLVAVALANKLARIVYAVMTTGTSYRAANA